MAKVDKLEVEITANASDLTRTLDNVQDRVKDFGVSASRSMNKLSASFGKAAKGLATFGLAVDGAQKAMAPFAAAINKLNDSQGLLLSAKRLGISTAKMQEFSFAARVSGINSETLADAMKDLSVKIKDASLGAKSYEEALNLVGLKSEDLLRLPVDQQFLRFADAVSKADDATKRFVLDEINDSMFQLLPLMDKGAAGFDKMAERAKQMGVIIDENGIEKMRESVEKINEMKIAWDSVYTRIAALVTGPMTDLLTSVDQALSKSDRFRDFLGLASGEGGKKLSTEEEREKQFEAGFPTGGQASTGELPDGPFAFSIGRNAMMGGGGPDTFGVDDGARQEDFDDEVEKAIEFQQMIDDAVLESKKRAKELESQIMLEETRKRVESEIEIEKKKVLAQKQILSSLSSLMNTESKKMFEVGKAAATAQAIMNTYEGVTKAMAQGGMFGWAQASAILAAGLNNVNNIQSTTFGGAGAGAASTGGAPGLGSDGSTVEAPSIQQTNVDVTLQGDSFSGDQIRGLIGQINEATDDNVKLNSVMAI